MPQKFRAQMEESFLVYYGDTEFLQFKSVQLVAKVLPGPLLHQASVNIVSVLELLGLGSIN
jgi:hypothetical protein